MSRVEPSAQRVRIEASGETHIGGRAHNEDSVLLRPEHGLFAVADGAGEGGSGHVASGAAVSSIAAFFDESPPDWAADEPFDPLGLPRAARRIAAAVRRAHGEVLLLQRASERHRGMGTTVAAALISPAEQLIHLAHVGDSRCYRLRDGWLDQLTMDHTLQRDVLELHPEIDDQRAAALPIKVTTSALGLTHDLRVAVRSWQIAAGDIYLLCTDGITRVLEDAEIWDVLRQPASPSDHARSLVERAIQAETSDNVAVVVIAVEAATALEPSIEAKRPRPTHGRPWRSSGSAAQASLGEPSEHVEILVVEAEPVPEPETPEQPVTGPGVRFVPPQALSDRQRAVLDDVLGPVTNPSNRDRRATNPYIDVEPCPHCGELVERMAFRCPFCRKTR